MHDHDANDVPGFDPQGLQTGDILLMMGKGSLSDLIAWASDGLYSHAAVVADAGELIEGAAVGVRRVKLSQRLADADHFHFIDAYRMPAQDQPLAGDDLLAILRQAESMLGIAYPVDQLALFGVLMAIRGKWPSGRRARWLVRVALDHAIPDRTGRMVCSEVVYRAFAECAVVPAGRLAPRIVVGPRGTAPFPEVDWVALFREFWPLLRPAGRKALQDARPGLDGSDVGASALFEDEGAEPADVAEVSDDELDRLRAALLAGTSAEQGGPKLLGDAGGEVDPRPNPRLVSPADLGRSPSLRRLGRVMTA